MTGMRSKFLPMLAGLCLLAGPAGLWARPREIAFGACEQRGRQPFLDDARASQVISGVPLLNKYGVKATFYVNPANVERELSAWKKAGGRMAMRSAIIPPRTLHGEFCVLLEERSRDLHGPYDGEGVEAASARIRGSSESSR